MRYDHSVFRFILSRPGGWWFESGTERNRSVSVKNGAEWTRRKKKGLVPLLATSADTLALLEALFSCVNRLINHCIYALLLLRKK
jgi:hypothetical protein